MRFGNDFAVPVNRAEPKSTCGKHQHFPTMWLINNHLVNWSRRRRVSLAESLYESHTASAPQPRWNSSALPAQRLSHPVRTSIFQLDSRPENVSVKGTRAQ